MTDETPRKQTRKLKSNATPAHKVVRPQHTDLMENGREYPDPTPIAPPVGFIKQPSLAETMKQMIRSDALRKAALESGAETFEEADDFDVGDDYDPRSPYEETFEVHEVEDPTPANIDALATAIHSKFHPDKATASAPTAPQPVPEEQGGPKAPPATPPSDPLSSFIPPR